MALSVSGIVSAVNNYLYSISDVANVSDEQTTGKSGLSSIFQKYLKKATQDIKDNSEVVSESEATKDATNEVAKEVAKDAVQTQTAVATTEKTSSADAIQIENVKTVFESMDLEAEILNNIAKRGVDVKSEITNNMASHVVDIKAELMENMAAHSRMDDFAISAVTESGASSTATGGDASANFDAYNGLLSSSALQQLANSSYFSANLIHSSILDGTTSESGEDSELSDLNVKSLNANALGEVDTSLSQTDYIASLINSYKSRPSTGVFGDFQV